MYIMDTVDMVGMVVNVTKLDMDNGRHVGYGGHSWNFKIVDMVDKVNMVYIEEKV